MYYVYVDHLYGIAYVSEEYLEYCDTYCETCGDSDTLIAECETMNEAIEIKIFHNRGEY